MNLKLSIAMVVCAFLGANAGTSFAQSTYYFSAPVTGGYQEIPFDDGAGYGQGRNGIAPGISSQLNFGTVNGVIIYNPSASTVQMQGNVAINYSSTVSFDDSHKAGNGSFTPAMVAIIFGVGNVNNGALSFDTGPVAQGSVMQLQIPINGTYTFTTGGQTYNGTFGYTLALDAGFSIQNVSPSSMTFSMNDLGFLTSSMSVPLADVNAENGLEMALNAQDASDGATYSGWQLNNVTATAPAPEPGTLALLAIGGLGLLVAIRSRQEQFNKNCSIKYNTTSHIL